ncbi:phosphonate C-P lyase system protein PhnL [Fulvimarina sp. 2208YS6-2-32]|uniref:Phosphonate C-P lyase system protein PhnL n=1 Tax=Fulvimarina uroteuthidis TaxID=3098149 RepID=A0ABU5I3H1_9HYPH|nr:phosphonate C-P lyase system protein PhnL [Fulvimarina sp. 2208YS6-2-32]MDY8109897.1 phosphonate C-P lyase system protein PhnL [Fulvimarina sp. 2208YS6-2-32]
MSDRILLRLDHVSKSFTNHLRGSVHLPVVDNVDFAVSAGEIVVLGGPSGVGKSSILRMIFGNYGIEAGKILMRSTPEGPFVDLAGASPRQIIALRRTTIGYVSQFLRAIPRVSALDVVAQPLREGGTDREEARSIARDLLARLHLPAALFDLPPATFSGGEKQRVNIARGFATSHPVLLLDEPTASLDTENRNVVCSMIEEKRDGGTAILGIFHDEAVRARLGGRIVDVSAFSSRRRAA